MFLIESRTTIGTSKKAANALVAHFINNFLNVNEMSLKKSNISYNFYDILGQLYIEYIIDKQANCSEI